MSERPTEIKISGLGGQGVILSGIIIGKAHAIFDGRHATMTQAFGPEARGSACSSQVLLSDSRILYPYVTRPDVLVVMSQEAYTRFSPELNDDGTLLLEADLVKPGPLPPRLKAYSIPATRIAEELGRKLVLNIVMTGFFTAVTGLISGEAVRKAVADSVPPGTEKLNLAAFEKGFAYGKQLLTSGAGAPSLPGTYPLR
ncbi:MAG: 2-oxoacid:acceptor oxidoreductase family protein [Elusimicrobia bacterium]|nr:2-oxoacid:acceptor oxidoreductase family protein [Elusimicrobiota bacterium]